MYPKSLQTKPSDLRANPWNSNHVAPDNEAKLTASIRQRGIVRPILVRETDTGLEILGGEHRWKVATDLGLALVPVLNFGPISEDEAKKIGLIDNTRYGQDDASELAVLLKSLGDVEGFQETMPFTDEELTSIFSSSTIALEDLDLDEAESESASEHETPVAIAPKTHAMMRFQVPLADAERLTDLITRTAKRQGFDAGTALMNAGDALCFLLLGAAVPPVPGAEEDAPEIPSDAFGEPL